MAKLSSFNVEGVEPTIDEIGASRQAFVALRSAADEALKQPVAERPDDLPPKWLEANGRLVRAIDKLSGQLESGAEPGRIPLSPK